MAADHVLEVSEPNAFVSGVRMEDDGAPKVEVRLDGDTRVRLQASDDLRDWTTVQDLSVSQGGRLDVVDDGARSHSKRYYRVKPE